MKVIHSVVCLSLCLLLCSCAMQPHETAKLYAVYAEEGEIDLIPQSGKQRQFIC